MATHWSDRPRALFAWGLIAAGLAAADYIDRTLASLSAEGMQRDRELTQVHQRLQALERDCRRVQGER